MEGTLRNAWHNLTPCYQVSGHCVWSRLKRLSYQSSPLKQNNSAFHFLQARFLHVHFRILIVLETVIKILYSTLDGGCLAPLSCLEALNASNVSFTWSDKLSHSLRWPVLWWSNNEVSWWVYKCSASSLEFRAHTGSWRTFDSPHLTEKELSKSVI